MEAGCCSGPWPSPYLYFWCYETPRVNRAPGARGGSRVFPHEGPALGGACWLSKTCRAKKKIGNPVALWLSAGGEFL